jgi:hypothetical protein
MRMADKTPESNLDPTGPTQNVGEEVQPGVYQVLVDHELDREGGMVKILQPRRKRKLFKEW